MIALSRIPSYKSVPQRSSLLDSWSFEFKFNLDNLEVLSASIAVTADYLSLTADVSHSHAPVSEVTVHKDSVGRSGKFSRATEKPIQRSVLLLSKEHCRKSILCLLTISILALHSGCSYGG